MGGKETFENLTQMVDHYQKESDGLVTRLQIPVVKTSGKVEYSVDSEDFKTCKSVGWDAVGVWGTVLCWDMDNCMGWVGRRMLNIDMSRY